MQSEQAFEFENRELPAWFAGAKLGIFIHWGLYSVPAYAPLSGEMAELATKIGWQAYFAQNPYAEWYANSIKIENSPSQRHHRATYGANFDYYDFVTPFQQAVQNWQPEEWASLFKKVGVRYVVLTTKHHDGFTLWPSRYPNPHQPGIQTQRDLVGELTAAVRQNGMRMGLYYSGGLDWSFNPTPIKDFPDLFGTIIQTPEYVEYVTNHWHELIDRYQPSVLWNDIGYPQAADLGELFSYFYRQIPDGVVNDRFRQRFAKPADPTAQPQRKRHYDFTTPEYKSFSEIVSQKWESCRGIGFSFGYNQNEDGTSYLSSEKLIHLLVDIVSKNGNLLLNIGPMADGTIPPMQRERLETLGDWLAVNGAAIFDTHPWRQAESVTNEVIPVRFTQKEAIVYATLLGRPTSERVSFAAPGLTTSGTVQLLGNDKLLQAWVEGDNFNVILPPDLPSAVAYTLKITG